MQQVGATFAMERGGHGFSRKDRRCAARASHRHTDAAPTGEVSGVALTLVQDQRGFGHEPLHQFRQMRAVGSCIHHGYT